LDNYLGAGISRRGFEGLNLGEQDNQILSARGFRPSALLKASFMAA
jgi:hypothetical protein